MWLSTAWQGHTQQLAFVSSGRTCWWSGESSHGTLGERGTGKAEEITKTLKARTQVGPELKTERLHRGQSSHSFQGVARGAAHI